MTITNEDVKRIAHLAKLKVTDDQLPNVANQLNGIFNWINKLNQLEVPEVYLLEEKENTVLERADNDPLPDQHDAILKNAPKKDHNFFVVPKVVE